jgi:hypothetical protein
MAIKSAKTSALPTQKIVRQVATVGGGPCLTKDLERPPISPNAHRVGKNDRVVQKNLSPAAQTVPERVRFALISSNNAQ